MAKQPEYRRITRDGSDVKRCYFCGAKTVTTTGAHGEPRPTIFHLSSCKPSRNYVKSAKKYQIEIEIPEIDHGGYVDFFTI